MTRIEELKRDFAGWGHNNCQCTVCKLIAFLESDLARKDAALREIMRWRDDPSAPYRNLTDAAELARSALTATATETGETK